METKTKSKFSTFINVLIDILFVPVLVLALFSSFLMYTAKKHNEVPSLFGYSSVVILSGSMEPKFYAGDYVLVKKVDTNNLEIGDIIAFYSYYTDNATDLVDETTPPNSGGNLNLNLLAFLGAGTTSYDQQSAIDSGSQVWFHQIVGIKVGTDPDSSIHRYFVTKGLNNSTADAHEIKDTMVVGTYVQNASFIASVFKFAGSSNGIILLVILPAGILLLLLSQSIIDQIIKLRMEKSENLQILKSAQQKVKADYNNTSNVSQTNVRPLDNVENIQTKTSTAPKQTISQTTQPKVQATVNKPVTSKPVSTKTVTTSAAKTKTPVTPKPQTSVTPTPKATPKPSVTVLQNKPLPKPPPKPIPPKSPTAK